jgi:hypothetical protein
MEELVGRPLHQIEKIRLTELLISTDSKTGGCAREGLFRQHLQKRVRGSLRTTHVVNPAKYIANVRVLASKSATAISNLGNIAEPNGLAYTFPALQLRTRLTFRQKRLFLDKNKLTWCTTT